MIIFSEELKIMVVGINGREFVRECLNVVKYLVPFMYYIDKTVHFSKTVPACLLSYYYKSCSDT